MGLFKKKKKNMSEPLFFLFLLTLQEELQRIIVIEFSSKEYEYDKGKSNLDKEASILALWAVIQIMPSDEELMDMFHRAYCHHLKYSEAQIKKLYADIYRRYPHYNQGYSELINNNDIWIPITYSIEQHFLEKNHSFSLDEIKKPGNVGKEVLILEFFTRMLTFTKDSLEEVKKVYILDEFYKN